MAEPLLILGASVRAAAQSAARLRLRLYCGDLFFDADLPDSVVGQVARSFPGDLARIAEQAPPSTWMYTGGLENYPRLVARVSRRHELLGTAPATLRRVRDPFELGRVFGAKRLLFPECRKTDERVPRDGSWLMKHRRSSGGLRVQACLAQSEPGGRGWYYQRRIEGLPIGAVFVAAGGRARLLGVSEQILTGSGRRPFQYAGSMGPVELSAQQVESVNAIGHALASEFDLRGLFGVDLVVAADGVWAIEVNPRYTASVEVLERAFGFNAVELQLAACRNQRLPEVETYAPRYFGKAVVYAEGAREFTVEVVSGLLDRNRGQLWPTVADIPRAGTRLKTGQPALTVFAEGKAVAVVRQELHTLARSIRTEFGV